MRTQHTVPLLLACVVSVLAIALLPKLLAIAACVFLLLAMERRRRRRPCMTVHNMAVFLAAGKLDISPVEVIYALRGVIRNEKAVHLHEKYTNAIQAIFEENGVPL